MLRVKIESFQIAKEGGYSAKEIDKAEIGQLAVDNSEWERLVDFVALIFRERIVMHLSPEEVEKLTERS